MQINEWVSTFKPKQFSFGETKEEGDAVFTLLGKSQTEYAEVLRANPACVWTELDTDGLSHIVPGVHIVNSVGYYVTEVAVEPGTNIEVEVWGVDDEVERLTDQILCVIENSEDGISPGLRSAITEFLKDWDTTHLMATESSKARFDGIYDEDEIEEIEMHLDELCGLEKITPETQEKLLTLLKRGSLRPEPNRKTGPTGP